MTHLFATTLTWLAITGYNPAPGNIPGAGTAMVITNWIAFLGFIGGLAGLVIGAIGIAVGRGTGASNMGIGGLGIVFWAGVAVLLIAGAAKIVNAFIAAGTNLS